MLIIDLLFCSTADHPDKTSNAMAYHGPHRRRTDSRGSPYRLSRPDDNPHSSEGKPNHRFCRSPDWLFPGVEGKEEKAKQVWLSLSQISINRHAFLHHLPRQTDPGPHPRPTLPASIVSSPLPGQTQRRESISDLNDGTIVSMTTEKSAHFPALAPSHVHFCTGEE